MLGLRIALTVTCLLVAAAAMAKPNKPECEAALPSVELAVAADCDCATAANHGQYVRCAGGVVKGMVASDDLPGNCKGAMVRVFAKSTCGKKDAATCCAPRGCKVKKAAACERLGGTPGSTPFCHDACGSPSGAFVD
jgi:hypothetical protein